MVGPGESGVMKEVVVTRQLFSIARPLMPGVPSGALGRLQREINALWAGGDAAPERHSGVYPPINLFETTEGYVLMAELPGMKLEDIEITLEGPRLRLRGERKIDYPRDERTSFLRREREAGIFRRTVGLPLEVDADRITASYRNGILEVRLPKASITTPRRIQVTAR